jgi:hypothetical protein
MIRPTPFPDQQHTYVFCREGDVGRPGWAARWPSGVGLVWQCGAQDSRELQVNWQHHVLQFMPVSGCTGQPGEP